MFAPGAGTTDRASTVDQTLIRGLVAPGCVASKGLPRSGCGGRNTEFLTRVPFTVRSVAPAPGETPFRAHAGARGSDVETTLAMAQMNPSSSRATAVIATCDFLFRASSVR